MTAEELHQAIGAFLISFGSSMPAELAHRIQKQAHGLAEQMERGGEPTVAKLTRGFGDAVAQSHPPR